MSQSRADRLRTPAPSFGAVIVAAGRGTRFGGTKHDLTVDGESRSGNGRSTRSTGLGIDPQCVVVGDVPGRCPRWSSSPRLRLPTASMRSVTWNGCWFMTPQGRS